MSISSAGSVEMSIDGPRSRVIAETGSVLEDIPILVTRKLLLGLLLILLKGSLKKF